MSGSRAGRYFESPDRKAFYLTFLFCLVWLVFALLSLELYSDDDLNHFMMARYAPHHPLLFLDIWGRPVFVILYSLGSQFGITGARATSVVVGGLVAWFSYIYARKRGYNRPWLIPIILAVMPRFFSMCYNLDTGLALCFVLSGALALHAYGKEHLSALAISLAPAARPEGALFIGIFAVFFIYKKKWTVLPLLAAGLLAWDMAGFAFSGDPLWLLHNQPWTAPYPYKFGLSLYFVKFTEITGPVHVPFFLAGLFFYFRKWKDNDNLLILFCWLAYFIFMVVVVWQGAFSTAGLTRYFNGATPLVALLSLAGLDHVLDSQKRREGLFVAALVLIAALFLTEVHAFGTVTLLASTLAFIIISLLSQKEFVAGYASKAVFAGLLVTAATNYYHLPVPAYSPIHLSIGDAADVYRRNSPASFTLSSDAWFCYFADKDPYDKSQNEAVTEGNLSNAPTGAVVLWEPHYAGGDRYGKVPLQQLLADGGYKLRWTDRVYSFLFEKTAGARPTTGPSVH